MQNHVIFSDQVALEIDNEVRKILEECYKDAKKLLAKHETLVLLIADALMENETLTKEQINSLVKTGKITPENNDSKEEEEKTQEEKNSKEDKPKESKKKENE